MTPAQLRLAAHMLEMAKDQLVNDGCNDFDLVRYGNMTPEEAQDFQAALVDWYGDGEPRNTDTMTMDWAVMGCLAAMLRKEAGV